jgi:hypothetical protein
MAVLRAHVKRRGFHLLTLNSIIVDVTAASLPSGLKEAIALISGE